MDHIERAMLFANGERMPTREEWAHIRECPECVMFLAAACEIAEILEATAEAVETFFSSLAERWENAASRVPLH